MNYTASEFFNKSNILARMLLETLDLRHNDILIYSQNVFNFNDSFKIIFKNSLIRHPQKISYFEVCKYVKDPSPKNLIIYRLLTNVNNLDAYSTKYGYFIKINGKMELIYFDPIFAIKDLRHLRFELDPKFFRFKIQQVGLTSLTNWENEPDFGEVYSFDLKAVEAQNQNDKIYADAIFAFDPNFTDEEILDDNKSGSEILKKRIRGISVGSQKGSDEPDDISEDSVAGEQKMIQPEIPENSAVLNIRDEIISLLKEAMNIKDEKIIIPKGSDFDKKTVNEVTEEKSEINLFDLFKTTNKSDELSHREKESVILKFVKK